MNKKLLVYSMLILLFSCNSKVNGTFYISNISQDRNEIPLRLIVDDDTIFYQNAKFTNIRPDLQYIENKKLTKGKHKIIFEVTNSTLKIMETVEFQNDKWIFLSYNYMEPADSTEMEELNKIFPIKDSTNLFLFNGQKPSLSFHVMEEKPNHH